MLNVLLLFCFVNYSGTPPVGTTISVTGEKGGNITLQCHLKAKKISYISLNSLSENIPVCPTEECSGRVFKQRNCDVVFKNLCFSDAGTYMLNIYYHNDQAELEQQIRMYQLHIQGEISVKIGEELKLDVLLSDADKVQHLSRSSTEWMKIWSRTDGVQREQITIRDRNLIISYFTAGDAGSYRVLDPYEEPLITETVTESGTESKEKVYNTDYVKSNDAIYNVIFWIVVVGLHVLALVIYIVPCAKKQRLILTNEPQCKEM